MSILIDRRLSLAEQQIKRLEQRRNSIADRLNKLHEAVAKITGTKGQSLYSLISLISSRKVKAIEAACVRLWLDYNGGRELPIRGAALLSAFIHPPELIELISAANDVAGESEDPEKYWAGNSFVAVPVSEAEKNEIKKRAEIRVDDEEQADIYRFVDQFAKTANLANQSRQVSPITIGDITAGGAARVYAPFIEIVHPKKGEPVQFRVKYSAFSSEKKEQYHAFDEGVVNVN
jgi:hypothetical protein